MRWRNMTFLIDLGALSHHEEVQLSEATMWKDHRKGPHRE